METKASKYAVRENKCKARYFAAQKKVDSGLSDSKDQGEALDALARKYLDLWVEHWASSLAAPEAAASVARLFATSSGNGFDAIPRWFGAAQESAAFRTAPNAGDRRVDELEKRVAALERRLAERDAGPGAEEPAVARPARRSRSRARKV
ncbi:MAG TPA: hypothetical protein VH722_05290 [Alphaproteobacteria bacterium]|nr:hypothetical protein [Alphaproteobacteria bacterium]